MEDSTRFCRFCGRVLRTKQSKERGFGEVCYKKYLKGLQTSLFVLFSKHKGVDNGPKQ